MSLFFRTRVNARALIGVALAGAGLFVVVGGVYCLTGQAHASVGPLRPESASQVTAPSATTGAVSVRAPAAPPTPIQVAPAALPAPVRSVTVATSLGDLDCLAAAVYYEARGESLAGQAAVAQVVLNRAKGPRFPKTVCGVVYQGAGGRACQFSFVCNGAMRRPREIVAWARSKDVAARALGGYVMAQIGQATCFHAARLGGGGGRVVKLGGHVFYAGVGRASAFGANRPVLLALAAPAGQNQPRLTFAMGVLTEVSGGGGGGRGAGSAPTPAATIAPSEASASLAAF